jgi:hypothetical protein
MFISEIFATKNSAKTKEIRWPKKPKKQGKNKALLLHKNWFPKAAQQAWLRGDVFLIVTRVLWKPWKYTMNMHYLYVNI